jgi:hypothetical protein
MAKNGHASSSKRKTHINIRYFFVSDRIASDEFVMQYCVTKEIIADIFTKLLQGNLFLKSRNIIMSVASSVQSNPDHMSVLENESGKIQWA